MRLCLFAPPTLARQILSTPKIGVESKMLKTQTVQHLSAVVERKRAAK